MGGIDSILPAAARLVVSWAETEIYLNRDGMTGADLSWEGERRRKSKCGGPHQCRPPVGWQFVTSIRFPPLSFDPIQNEGRRHGGFGSSQYRQSLRLRRCRGPQFPDPAVLRRRGVRYALTINQAWPLAHGILNALEFAHSLRIVHRDVSPWRHRFHGQIGPLADAVPSAAPAISTVDHESK